MNKKIIFLILLVSLLLVVPAQAGIIDWFLELFGLGDNGYPLNYAEGNGFISYTDRVYYNSFKDGYGNTIAGEYYLYNVTSDKNTNDCVYFISEQDDINSDIPKIYMRDVYSANRSLWIDTTQASTKEIKNNKFKKKSQTYNINAYETLEFKVEYKPSKENSKISLYLYNCKGDLLNTIDPYYNSTLGFYTARIYNGNIGGILYHRGNYYISGGTTGTDAMVISNYTSSGIWVNNITMICSDSAFIHGITGNESRIWFIAQDTPITALYLCENSYNGGNIQHIELQAVNPELRVLTQNGSTIILTTSVNGDEFYGYDKTFTQSWYVTGNDKCFTGTELKSGMYASKGNFYTIDKTRGQICNWTAYFLNATMEGETSLVGSFGIGKPNGITNNTEGGLTIIDGDDKFAYVLIGDSPPVVSNISIKPLIAYNNDTLNISFGISDSDNSISSVSYNISVLKNNVLQFSYNKSLTSSFASMILNNNNFTHNFNNDTWMFNIVAKDGVTTSIIYSSNISLSSLIIINNATYDISTLEFSDINLNLNISLLNGNLINGFLVWNNTNYNTDIEVTPTNYILSKNINVGTFSGDSRINFTWIVNTTYEQRNSSYNQTIYKLQTPEIRGDNCSAGLYPAMYFNFKDEGNLSTINVSIQYNFKFGSSNNTALLNNNTIISSNHLYLCINSTIYNNYSIGYGEIQYQGDGYVKRRFYVFNNLRVSNMTTTNILYDLLNADATSFLLTVKDTALSPYINKYIGLLRWYPNLNSYNTVDMGLTDDKGQTVIRVKTEDVDYRLALYELNGSLIKLFNPIRMVCLSSPCEYSAVVIEQGSDMTIFEKIENGLTYNPTLKIFTFAWNDPSQLTQSMRLLVEKERGDYFTTICDTSSSGYTGIINCNVSGQTGTIRAQAFRTASPEVPIAEKIISIVNNLFKSTTGLFIVAIAFIFFTFVGIFSPIAAIVFGVVGLLIGVAFGVFHYGLVIAIGVLGGIIIHFMRNR